MRITDNKNMFIVGCQGLVRLVCFAVMKATRIIDNENCNMTGFNTVEFLQQKLRIPKKKKQVTSLGLCLRLHVFIKLPKFARTLTRESAGAVSIIS